jgi:hypothetical protein
MVVDYRAPMLKRYTFWMTAAACFQLFTSAVHAVSLFVDPRPENDVERQMITLISTYRLDMDFGFHPTFANLFTALSSCFSMLFLFAALVNGYLLIKHTGSDIIKGILAINVVIFGVCLVIMAVFTFLPPIALTSVVLGNLVAAYFLCPKPRIETES